MQPILVPRALGLLKEVLWRRALLGGLADIRRARAGRLFALTLLRISRWGP